MRDASSSVNGISISMPIISICIGIISINSNNARVTLVVRHLIISILVLSFYTMTGAMSLTALLQSVLLLLQVAALELLSTLGALKLLILALELLLLLL